MRRPKNDPNKIRCPHCKQANARPVPGIEAVTCEQCGREFPLHLCPNCGKWENAEHFMCEVRQKGAAVCGDCKRRGGKTEAEVRTHYREMQRLRWAGGGRREDNKTAADIEALADIAEGL